MAHTFKIAYIHQWDPNGKSLCGVHKISERNKLLKNADKYLPCEDCTKVYVTEFQKAVMKKQPSKIFMKNKHCNISLSLRIKLHMGMI